MALRTCINLLEIEQRSILFLNHQLNAFRCVSVLLLQKNGDATSVIRHCVFTTVTDAMRYLIDS